MSRIVAVNTRSSDLEKMRYLFRNCSDMRSEAFQNRAKFCLSFVYTGSLCAEGEGDM
jgi:hypothetical protein